MNADTWYALDDRFIPTGTDSVEGTDNDLRGGRRVGDVSLNVALTGLVADDGVYRHRLAAPDGVTTELWASDDFAYVQVFTRPGFPDPDGEALAVAIEPMTAPADALNSGEGLRWLAPGEEWLTTWGIRRVF